MRQILVLLIVSLLLHTHLSAQTDMDSFYNSGRVRFAKGNMHKAKQNFAAAKIVSKNPNDSLQLWQHIVALRLQLDTATTKQQKRILPKYRNSLQRLIQITTNDTTAQTEYIRIEQWGHRQQELIFIPGSKYMIGSNFDPSSPESPMHQITISSYRIQRLEVSNGEYIQFLNHKKRHYNKNSIPWITIGKSHSAIYRLNGMYMVADSLLNHPVVSVTWHGAMAYAQNYGMRLPTEAEYEYANKGGALERSRAYKYLNHIGQKAWYNANAPMRQVQTRATRKPNKMGIYDMAGNVWEWCSDWFDSKFYRKGVLFNPVGPPQGKQRIIRGGSSSSPLEQLRPEYRGKFPPLKSDRYIGFRCAKDG